MRTLEAHKGSSANNELEITVRDEPGPGGACHEYRINLPPQSLDGPYQEGPRHFELHFQNGPIGEVGVNGLTEEALLAILIDRLEGHQSGKFACGANTIALGHVRSALWSLHGRTRDRQELGIEGTHEVGPPGTRSKPVQQGHPDGFIDPEKSL